MNNSPYFCITRRPHARANAQLQMHLENSKSGHNCVKKILWIPYSTGMGSPFDSTQLV